MHVATEYHAPRPKSVRLLDDPFTQAFSSELGRGIRVEVAQSR